MHLKMNYFSNASSLTSRNDYVHFLYFLADLLLYGSIVYACNN